MVMQLPSACATTPMAPGGEPATVAGLWGAHHRAGARAARAKSGAGAHHQLNPLSYLPASGWHRQAVAAVQPGLGSWHATGRAAGLARPCPACSGWGQRPVLGSTPILASCAQPDAAAGRTIAAPPGRACSLFLNGKHLP